jgi:hypothetical protein
MVLNFFSRTVTPSRQPSCPHCGRKKLQREVSMFSAGSKHNDGDGGDDGLGDLPIDENKMGQALEALSSEAESMNEEDPRAAAQLMRKFSKMTGMEYNENIESALARMEAGEDPEAIETEMGDALDDADPFVLSGGAKGGKGKSNKKKRGAPRHDPTLHDL